MKIRTQPNFNFETGEDVFGLSIRIDGAHRYCKYPAGYQNYKTITEAKKKVLEQLYNGVTSTSLLNKSCRIKT